MTTLNFNFDAIANGTELSTGQTEFAKLAGFGTNTIVVNSWALDFVGTSGTPSTYAYNTGQSIHEFSVTYAGSNASGSFIPCCIRISDFRNLIGSRFSTATTMELLTLVNGTPTTNQSATVTRTASDVVRMTVDANNLVSVYLNGVLKLQQTIANFSTATRVGFCARSSASNQIITAASTTYGVTPTVVSINSGTNSVQLGSTNNTVTTTGMATATGADIAGVAMTSLAGSNNAFTFSCPTLTDGQKTPYPSGTFTITDGTNSPTLANVAITLPTGFSPVTLSGALNTTNTGVLYNFSPAAVVTDYILYTPVPASGKYTTVDAQGNLDTNFVGTQTMWHIQASTGIARSYTVTTSAGSNVITITRTLSAKTLTAKTLTARSL